MGQHILRVKERTPETETRQERAIAQAGQPRTGRRISRGRQSPPSPSHLPQVPLTRRAHLQLTVRTRSKAHRRRTDFPPIGLGLQNFLQLMCARSRAHPQAAATVIRLGTARESWWQCSGVRRSPLRDDLCATRREGNRSLQAMGAAADAATVPATFYFIVMRPCGSPLVLS